MVAAHGRQRNLLARDLHVAFGEIPLLGVGMTRVAVRRAADFRQFPVAGRNLFAMLLTKWAFSVMRRGVALAGMALRKRAERYFFCFSCPIRFFSSALMRASIAASGSFQSAPAARAM